MPSTHTGCSSRMTLRAWNSALISWNGAFSSDSLPLPRRPVTSIRCSGRPAAGTSSFSIPRGVPSQCALEPRALNSRARPGAGNACPPVPPAMISTLPRMLNLLGGLAFEEIRFFEVNVFIAQLGATLPLDTQQQRQAAAADLQGAAAVAEEWQSQPLGRQQANVHAD